MADTKGNSLVYPKVITSSPFNTVVSSRSKGAEHQALLDLATCSASHSTDLWLGGAAADDVAFYYRPAAACQARVRACSDSMSTELAVFALDEVRCHCAAGLCAARLLSAALSLLLLPSLSARPSAVQNNSTALARFVT